MTEYCRCFPAEFETIKYITENGKDVEFQQCKHCYKVFKVYPNKDKTNKQPNEKRK